MHIDLSYSVQILRHSPIVDVELTQYLFELQRNFVVDPQIQFDWKFDEQLSIQLPISASVFSHPLVI